MSLKDLANLDPAQLKEKREELRKDLFNLRSRNVTEKVKDVSQFRKLRQDIARVETLLRRQETATK